LGADACIIGAGWRDEAEQRARSVMADMVEGRLKAEGLW
jgi:hypothetical protein